MTYIYLITNISGGSVYIGKTKNKSQREYMHKSRFGENIDIDYIDSIDSLESNDWKKLEVFWIEQFRQWGFKLENKNKGGGGCSSHSELTKNKISLSNKWKLKGVKRPEEVLLKMPLFKSGNKLFFGKNHSEETKIKLRNANLGKKVNEDTKRKISEKKKGIRAYDNNKSVIQCDLSGGIIKVFTSITEASIETNSCRTKISDCCKGKRKTTNKFKWKYNN
jgi:group I intron endonuclease